MSEQIVAQDEIRNIKIQEVEFKMAKKKLNPKDEDEFEYECGKCGAEFATKHKYCPECGVEFGD
jgi:rRNA maturation endonuclease Nob1